MASGQGRPIFRSAQVKTPESMNTPGMLKFRKFRIPMVSVNATATRT